MAQTKVQLLQPDLGDVIDFDASTLFVDGADNRIGIRNTNPQYELDVTGTINATNFRGNISVGTIDDWITHTGDTNTKFGFPAADAFAVETNGTEKLRIDSSGRLLVGTAVAPASANTLLRVHTPINTSSANSIEIGHDTNGADKAGAALGLAINNGGASTNAADLYFSTATNGSLVQRLWIKSDGKLSLGTSTARQRLHIHEASTGACNLVFTNTTTGTAAADGMVIGLGGGGDPNGQIWHQETKAIKFGTSDTERLRIDSSGRLLISGEATLDSTSLVHPLQVRASNVADAIAVIGRTADDIGELSFYEADKSTKLGELQYRRDHLNFRHRVGYITFCAGGTAEKLRITSGGNVNIGGDYAQTDSKVTIIDANRPIQEATLNLQSSTTSGAANTGAVLRFYGHSGTEGRYHSSIKGAKENGTSGNYAGYLAFNTRPNGGGMSESLRIHSTGKVTIASGTKAQETSTGLLLLDKDLTAESDVGDPNNYHLVIRSQSNSNTSKLGIGFQNTTDDNKIGAAILHHRTGGGSIGDLAFYTSPSDGTVTEAFRISSTGTLRMDQAGTNTNVLANDTGGPNIWLKNTSDTNGNYSKIGFFNSTGYITAFMAAQYQDAGDRNTDLVFGTRSNGNALAERLRLDSTGHLHIKGQNHEVRFYRDDGARYGAITYDGSNFNIRNPVNDHTRVCKQDGTEIIKFRNDKKVVIDNTDGTFTIGGDNTYNSSKINLQVGSMSQTSATTESTAIVIHDQNSKRNGTESSGSWVSGIRWMSTQINGGSRYGAFINQDITYNNFSGGATKMRSDLVFGTRGDAQTSSSDNPTEKLRITHSGTIQSVYGIQPGGNATGGFKLNSQYSGKGFDIATQYATQSNSGSNGADPMFSGWWGSVNTFRVNTDGQIKFGSNLVGGLRSGGFSIPHSNASGNTKTVTIAGLVSGAAYFSFGTYSSAGQGMAGICVCISGYQTATSCYQIQELQKWHTNNMTITSFTKWNTYASFTITNTHGSFTAGAHWHLWGNDECYVQVA